MRKLSFILLACVVLFVGCDYVGAYTTVYNKSSYDVEFYPPSDNSKTYSLGKGEYVIIPNRTGVYSKVIVTNNKPVYSYGYSHYTIKIEDLKEYTFTLYNSTDNNISVSVKSPVYDQQPIILNETLAAHERKNITIYSKVPVITSDYSPIQIDLVNMIASFY